MMEAEIVSENTILKPLIAREGFNCIHSPWKYENLRLHDVPVLHVNTEMSLGQLLYPSICTQINRQKYNYGEGKTEQMPARKMACYGLTDRHWFRNSVR